tara:strand:+ start:2214 stop:2864 length:651 start_codon:yes stop_codon:yes gene_type:complete
MCNLYDIGPGRQRNRNEWEATITAAFDGIQKNYGIRKTDLGPVIVQSEQDKMEAHQMRWGFRRSFNPAVNNARTDKLDGPWATPWKEKRRCLIPMSTFYEWTGPTGGKQTFAFEFPKQDDFIWAAGIWEPGDNEPAYSMLTTDASPSVSRIHDRMPALLDPATFMEFLSASDPRHLLAPWAGPLDIFRCENPLKGTTTTHKGPQRQDLLPGFDGID